MKSRLSARARTEAAAWVVCLHGEQRTSESEAACRKWLAEDPEHARAFEFVTEVWEKSGRLRRRSSRLTAGGSAANRWTPLRAAFVAALAASVAAIAVFVSMRTDAITTEVGELRIVVLEDGSRVHLNTDSQVVPAFDKTTRRVALIRGEAFFEVAKNPQRPFIVSAGDRQVRALGTSFIVRHDPNDFEVTLVEGKVTVSSPGTGSAGRALQTPEVPAAQQSALAAPDRSSVVLNPGQRLTIAEAGVPKLDTPQIERVTAWQRGEVALDATPLADAVAEMNRYSEQRIVIAGPEVAAIRIGGVFKAGDQANFARAVALAYDLELREQDQTIILGSSAQR